MLRPFRLDSMDDVRDLRQHPAEVAFQMDLKLRRFAREHVLTRRVLGRGLAILVETDSLKKLGYSVLADYADERLGLGDRHAQDLAWIERQIRSYPTIDRMY